MDARDRPQATEPGRSLVIGNAPRGNSEQQVLKPVRTGTPAELIAARGKLEGPRSREREAGAPLHLADEPFEATGVDRVLQPRVLAIAAIAEIALRGHDRFGHREQLLGRHEADHITEARIGSGLAVGGAEAAAYADIEAAQFFAFDDGNESQILRKHVDVIARRNRDPALELARQVGAAEDRLCLGLRAGRVFEAHAVEPDLVIGARAGQQMLREAPRPQLHLGMRR